VPQGTRSDAAQARVAVDLRRHLPAPLGLDVRQLQFLAEDLRQLLQRHLDLELVLAGFRARLARTGLALAGDGVARLAVALADAAALVGAEAEARQVDLRHRDADRVRTLATHHRAVGDVLAQVAANGAAHDAAKASVVEIDAVGHRALFSSPSTSRPHARRCSRRS
jgi:hypothetical protein